MFLSPETIFKRFVIILFALFILLALSIQETNGVPIALAMGCGRSLDLAADKKAFCCEHFNLDCPVLKNISPKDPSRNVQEKMQELTHHRRSFRLLGESCSEAHVRCATGLYCRGGICVRRCSEVHLKSLTQRGRLVEQEERENMSPQSGEKRKSPFPAQNDLILEGQSVKASDVTVRPDKLARDIAMEPRKTPTPQSSNVSHGAARIDDIANHSGFRTTADPQRPLNEEEDELTANIADLLSLKLGINLNSAELHSVREIIAGTLDERAEREDEVVQNESKRDMEGSLKESQTVDSERHVETVEDESPKQYRYYSHYEPLVQCSSEKKRHSPAKEISESLRTMTAGVGSTLHAGV